jgi:CrcB protein
MNALTLAGFLAVAIGSVLGAWLRWLLAVAMNTILPSLPLGTLVANLGGGFMIGVALGVLNEHLHWSPEWRLFVITGFLGGLTTFSSFSAEAMLLLQERQYVWAALHVGTHVIGSIACCFAGYALVQALK